MLHSYQSRGHEATGETLFNVRVEGEHWTAHSEVRALVEASEVGRTTVMVYASGADQGRPFRTGSVALYIDFAGEGAHVSERAHDAYANGGLINFTNGGKTYESVAFELTLSEVSDRVVRGTVAAVLEAKESEAGEAPAEFVLLSSGEFVASVVGGF